MTHLNYEVILLSIHHHFYFSLINICILDVIKCHDGFYGDRCHLNCSPRCKTCNLTDGVCLVCKDGYYGNECVEECSQNCNTNVCDKQDGRCNCTVGYAGHPCKECPSNCDKTGCGDTFHCFACAPGFYGDLCNQTCSEHCQNKTCNKVGRCNCSVGYGGHPCEPCPKNCSDTGCDEQLKCHECDPGFLGDYCNLTCSTNCGTCNRDGRCYECDSDFYGYFCNLTCPTNCINGTCNRNGSCTCKKGFTGLGCCPVNCEGVCNDTTFVCTSCKDGYHGDFCKETCPDNCTNGCTRDGKKCTTCALRHWGPLCEKDCPGQCSTQCEQDNGTCPCNPGFVGRQCQRKNCFFSVLHIQNT